MIFSPKFARSAPLTQINKGTIGGDRDGRLLNLNFENRAPDLIEVDFVTNLRNNRAKKHNQVKFEPTDVILTPFNNTKSVVKFGLN